MSLVSFCFPVYHNEGALSILYHEIKHQFQAKFPEDEYELIFVNDGSRDNSLEELYKLREIDKRVKIISFSRNFGQMAAMVAGWRYATGDAVINLAADLQDPPEQCMKMIQQWKTGSEVVISYRTSHGTSFSRKITSRIFYKLMLPKIPPGGFDFALVDKKALNVLNQLKERNRFYQYDLLWLGFNVKFIPYDKAIREIGRSQYSFLKRFGNFYTAYLNVSYLPLRILSFLGVIVSITGFLYALNIVYSYFINQIDIPGWTPIMVTLLFLCGLIMIMIGVLGEYVWRILDEVKQRPTYIIDEEHL